MRIQQEACAKLKAHFARLAVQRSVEELGRELRALPYEPYAPVRDQLRGVLRAVNHRRQAAGLERLPRDVLRQWRKPMRPFDETADGTTLPPAAKLQ